VVTLLGEDEDDAAAPLPDGEAALPVLSVEDVEDVVRVVGVVDWFAVDACAARAGSCPETRTSAITSQTAMNSATAPATNRRRSIRVRSARACRIACVFADVMAGRVTGPRSSAVRNR
jgi:hypothetical protein